MAINFVFHLIALGFTFRQNGLNGDFNNAIQNVNNNIPLLNGANGGAAAAGQNANNGVEQPQNGEAQQYDEFGNLA